MGLDMYLHANRYVSPYIRDTEGKIIQQALAAIIDVDVMETPIDGVSLRVGYWRKANQIHKWFVDNVQEGTDNCEKFDVSLEQLVNLKTLCQSVIDANTDEYAGKYLPRVQGFFFGADEYDHYYYEDLRDTIAIVDAAIRLTERGAPKSNPWSFEYQASW